MRKLGKDKKAVISIVLLATAVTGVCRPEDARTANLGANGSVCVIVHAHLVRVSDSEMKPSPLKKLSSLFTFIPCRVHDMRLYSQY